MARIKISEHTTKREVIVAEATKLFKEKGFNASSMRDLADRVGVEAPSLYNHITSKTELLTIICFNFANRFTEKISDVEKENLSVTEKAESLLRFHINEMINNYEEVYVCDREWRNLKDPQLSKFRELRRGYRRRFSAIIQQGIEAKEIKDIDANTAVMIFLNAIAAVDQWHRIVHKVSSQKLEDDMVAVLIDGIRR
jgi:TetR/AcrR family transcriptional regulator, cholesterol catabolism regulator